MKYLRTKRAGNARFITLKECLLDTRLVAKGRSLVPSWLIPQQRYYGDSSFIPCPKIAFLIDHPSALLCQICRDSRFRLQGRGVDGGYKDTTFSILPCGHVAGAQCLETWCSAYGTCPFCRMELRYPGCGHRILPRPITHESIHVLPRTEPDGGSIPDSCSECIWERLLADAEVRFTAKRQKFQAARRQVERTGDWGDERELLRAKEEVEMVMRDEVFRPYLQCLLDSW